MTNEDIAGILLTASASVSAMLLGVIGVLIAVRETARLSVGAKGLTRYQMMIYLVLTILILSAASTLCSLSYLSSFCCSFDAGLILFVVALVGAVGGTLVIAVLTRK